MDEFKLGEMIGEIKTEIKGLSSTQTEILDKFCTLPCSDHDTRIKDISAPKKVSIETLKAIPHIGKILALIAGAAGTVYASFK